jgi:integrase
VADLERYLDAATRANTQRSYGNALRHYEVEAGRLLPATPDQVAQYLADYAQALAVTTLRQRLAALGRWHRDHGFTDPTHTPLVRQVIKGIAAVHGEQAKQAAPLALTQVGQVADWLDSAIAAAQQRSDADSALRHQRDRAWLLLGFWRGFRGDELIRLQVQHLKIVPGEGMHCFLPSSKGDRENLGRSYPVPALSRWCPVTAMSQWLEASGLRDGPVFRGINRWGQLRADPLHANSFIRIMRGLFTHAGLPTPEEFSGHSLRRGFAGWASAQGWDLKSLMEYVGWKDVNSALRYLDADPFARLRIEAALPAGSAPAAPPALAAPAPPPAPVGVPVELRLVLRPLKAGGRGRANALRVMETACLARLGAVRTAKDGSQFRLTLTEKGDALDEAIAELLDELYEIADGHQCSLEARVREIAGSRRWD